MVTLQGESQADHRERLQILSNWVSVIFFERIV